MEGSSAASVFSRKQERKLLAKNEEEILMNLYHKWTRPFYLLPKLAKNFVQIFSAEKNR